MKNVTPRLYGAHVRHPLLRAIKLGEKQVTSGHPDEEGGAAVRGRAIRFGSVAVTAPGIGAQPGASTNGS
jgi:hypothetical protein